MASRWHVGHFGEVSGAGVATNKCPLVSASLSCSCQCGIGVPEGRRLLSEGPFVTGLPAWTFGCMNVPCDLCSSTGNSEMTVRSSVHRCVSCEQVWVHRCVFPERLCDPRPGASSPDSSRCSAALALKEKVW